MKLNLPTYAVAFRFLCPSRIRPIEYKGVKLDCQYKIDLLVDEFLVVELKAVEQLTGVHEAQLLTYMKLAEAPVGLLVNFNVQLLKNGIRRFVL